MAATPADPAEYMSMEVAYNAPLGRIYIFDLCQVWRNCGLVKKVFATQQLTSHMVLLAETL